jgi:histidinol-phosphate/aromatic aminotransferase/cobyric acid decarboxylase-like protein
MSMSFEFFEQMRADITGERPDILDLSETSFARVMKPYRLDPARLKLPEGAHRCHLAEDWLALFGLPSGWRARALVSSGVRDSLDLLFGWFSDREMKVGIPSDVYPVYERIAFRNRLRTSRFPTFPRLDLDMAYDCDAVLVCNPSKPRGWALTGAELESLLGWLREDPGRRVIIDAVYTFGDRFEPSTLRLLETGQAWLLHSLSKG